MTSVLGFFDENYKLQSEKLSRRKSELLVGFAPVGIPKSAEGKLKQISRVLNECSVAITITIRDNMLMKYKERYMIGLMGYIAERTRGVERYCFVNDYSETGRFHVHGGLSVKNVHVTEILRKKFVKTFGFVKVKIIDNVPKWAEYCVQQYSDDGKNGVVIDTDLILYECNE